MKKIAFLRSIEIQQTGADLGPLGTALAEQGLTAKLFYTHGDCGAGEFPGAAERLPLDVSAAEVVRRVREWGADGVISLSIPDENALRDAIAGERLAEAGVPAVMHPVAATTLMSNKWDTKQLIGRYGLSTPDGILIDGDLLNGRTLPVPAYLEYLARQAREIGYPLLTKPLWDCLANGVRFIAGPADLSEYLRSPYNGNVVLERCVEGELCSVEIIGRDGQFVVQPLIWKGPTGGAPSFVFQTMRYAAPRAAADAAFKPVCDRLLWLCQELGLNGAIEIEMIYEHGVYHVIEINPRVSGTTSLSIATSGTNTYLCLLDILLGKWSAEHAVTLGHPRRLTFQIPTLPMDDAASRAAAASLDLVRASTFTVGDKRYANMVITCEYQDAPALSGKLAELNRRHPVILPATLAELERVLADIGPAEAVQPTARPSLVG